MGSADVLNDNVPFTAQNPDFMGLLRTTIAEQPNFWDAEQRFDKEPWVMWLSQHWRYAYLFSAIYLVIVFGGQQFMKNREKMDLRYSLTLWNMTLAFGSMWGALRCNVELVETLYSKGWKASVIDMSFYDGPSGFWVLIFALSKVLELGDTVFIVLRKQPLIFLHWYHHIATLCYAWNSYAEQTATGRWFVAMNVSIHSVMYSYYALRAMKFRIPRIVMIAITSGQILQMVVGTSIGIYIYHLKISGEPVNQTWRNLGYQFVMYASYVVLFCRFFYFNYFVPRKALEAQKTKSN